MRYYKSKLFIMLVLQIFVILGYASPVWAFTYSTARRVEAQEGFNRISAIIKLPETRNISGINAKMGEAAYNFYSIYNTGTGEIMDFGLGKDKKDADKNIWTVYVNHYFPNGTSKWLDFNSRKIQPYIRNGSRTVEKIQIPDGTSVHMQLYVSKANEVTLNIAYGSKNIRITQVFDGVNDEGQGFRLMRECSLITKSGWADQDYSQKNLWKDIYLYDQQDKYVWNPNNSHLTYTSEDYVDGDAAHKVEVKVITANPSYTEIVNILGPNKSSEAE
ncbi:MAG TPA: hypothetical protein DER33_04975 [Syntrophomonas sp.]|nr:hypothetical protein [Syntrophomonas sp.]HCF70931.1 hypothetical protein [Syntrophomonas sp.]